MSEVPPPDWAAMESLMKSPPANVQNWQAVLVTAAKRRALDLCHPPECTASS
jgi:hypothetical protein